LKKRKDATKEKSGLEQTFIKEKKGNAPKPNTHRAMGRKEPNALRARNLEKENEGG